jgi:hypothetical protein
MARSCGHDARKASVAVAWIVTASLEVRTVRPSGAAFQESVMTIQEKLDRAFDLRGTPANTRRTYRLCIGGIAAAECDRPGPEAIPRRRSVRHPARSGGTHRVRQGRAPVPWRSGRAARGAVVLEVLARRFASLELDGEPTRRRVPVLRAYERLPVRPSSC